MATLLPSLTGNYSPAHQLQVVLTLKLDVGMDGWAPFRYPGRYDNISFTMKTVYWNTLPWIPELARFTTLNRRRDQELARESYSTSG